MKKILHYKLTNHTGGIESFISNVTPLIPADEFQIYFVTSSEYPAHLAELSQYGSFLYVNESNIFLYIHSLFKIFSKKFDIVHFHKNSLIDILPIVFAKIFGSKIIVHAHNTSSTLGASCLTFIHYFNRKFVKYLANIKIACSAEAGKWMFGKQKFYIIPNGIEVNRYRYNKVIARTLKHSLSIPETDIVLGCVARLEKQKNYYYTIQLFKEINRSIPNTKLLIIGNGSLEKDLKRRCNDIGIADSVIFLGEVSDVESYLSTMDIFILSSFHEGLPISVVEAQASGLICFLSDSISKEVEITNLVNYFSLNDDFQQNVNYILNKISRSRPHIDRKSYAHVLMNSRFNVINTGRYMHKIYTSL